MTMTLPPISSTLRPLVAAGLLLAASLSATAQVQNCSLPAGSGGTLSTSQPSICADGSLWAPPSLTGYTAGLTRTEYLFQDPSDIVYNDDSTVFGPRILAINLTGAFDPQAAGLVDGDQFIVTAFNYNIADLQDFAQALLNGSFLFTPCCTFAELVQGIDVCSVYNSIGVFNGSDITNLNVWVSSIQAFGGPASINNIIFSFNEINAQAGQPCTDALPLCYATSSSITVDITCSSTCSSATAPTGQSHTTLSNRIRLDWTPNAGAVGCQVNGKRVPTGPQPSVNVLSAPYNTTNVPFSVAGAGTTWTWRVRCACSITPLDVSPYTVYGDTFSIPVAREMQDLPSAEQLNMLSLYPNPATNQLTVEGGMGMNSLEIIDAVGRLRQVMQIQEWSGGQQTIQLNNLEPGFYMLVGRYTSFGAEYTETLPFSVQ